MTTKALLARHQRDMLLATRGEEGFPPLQLRQNTMEARVVRILIYNHNPLYKPKSQPDLYTTSHNQSQLLTNTHKLSDLPQLTTNSSLKTTTLHMQHLSTTQLKSHYTSCSTTQHTTHREPNNILAYVLQHKQQAHIQYTELFSLIRSLHKKMARPSSSPHQPFLYIKTLSLCERYTKVNTTHNHNTTPTTLNNTIGKGRNAILAGELV